MPGTGHGNISDNNNDEKDIDIDKIVQREAPRNAVHDVNTQ